MAATHVVYEPSCTCLREKEKVSYNKELYNKIPRMQSSIREQRIRFVGHYWRRKNDLVSDVLLRTTKYGYRSRGRLVKTFTDTIIEDTV